MLNLLEPVDKIFYTKTKSIMKNNPIYLSDLHFEHKTWKSELLFQQDELKTFKSRLEEVVPRYTDTTVLAKAEQFQNKMIRYNEVLDQLIHDINTHEHTLSTYAKEHPVAIDHVHFDDHGGLRGKIKVQGEIHAEFKANFLRYLTEYM